MSDSSLPAVDPRVAVRRPITLRVRLAWDVDECLGYSTNISLSGIYVETRDYLPEGTAVRVEFDLAEAGGLGRVYVDGAVARHIGEKEAEDRQLVPGVGIRFGEFVVGKFDLIRFLTPTKKAAEPVEADPLEPAPDEGDVRRPVLPRRRPPGSRLPNDAQPVRSHRLSFPQRQGHSAARR